MELIVQQTVIIMDILGVWVSHSRKSIVNFYGNEEREGGDAVREKSI